MVRPTKKTASKSRSTAAETTNEPAVTTRVGGCQMSSAMKTKSAGHGGSWSGGNHGWSGGNRGWSGGNRGWSGNRWNGYGNRWNGYGWNGYGGALALTGATLGTAALLSAANANNNPTVVYATPPAPVYNPYYSPYATPGMIAAQYNATNYPTVPVVGGCAVCGRDLSNIGGSNAESETRIGGGIVTAVKKPKRRTGGSANRKTTPSKRTGGCRPGQKKNKNGACVSVAEAGFW